MSGHGLSNALKAKYGEAIDSMSFTEFNEAIRSTIRSVTNERDFGNGVRSATKIMAAYDFPHLTDAQLEQVVDARLTP